MAIRKKLPNTDHAPPKQRSQLQRIQQVSSPCCLRLHKSQSQESWRGCQSSCSLHFLSLGLGCIDCSCTQSRPCWFGLGVTRKPRQTSRFLDCASKEASRPGLRKLGEAWRPPWPRGESKGAEGLACPSHITRQQPSGGLNVPLTGSRAVSFSLMWHLHVEVEPLL